MMENIQNEFVTKKELQVLVKELATIFSPLKEYLSVEELSVYLDISKSAVYKITGENKIPVYSPGGKKKYFKKSEVNAWIESARVASDAEILAHYNDADINSNSNGLW